MTTLTASNPETPSKFFWNHPKTKPAAVVLSKRKADRIRGWQQILHTRAEGDEVEGKCMRKIKGGLLVDIGVPVFLPASQVDIRRPR